MSTCYLPLTRIDFDGLRAGLPMSGLTEDLNPQSSEGSLCLTDGRSYLCSFPRGTARGTLFVRYGENDVEGILTRLAEHFETEFFDEYDDVFAKLDEELDANTVARRSADAMHGGA